MFLLDPRISRENNTGVAFFLARNLRELVESSGCVERFAMVHRDRECQPFVLWAPITRRVRAISLHRRSSNRLPSTLVRIDQTGTRTEFPLDFLEGSRLPDLWCREMALTRRVFGAQSTNGCHSLSLYTIGNRSTHPELSTSSRRFRAKKKQRPYYFL